METPQTRLSTQEPQRRRDIPALIKYILLILLLILLVVQLSSGEIAELAAGNGITWLILLLKIILIIILIILIWVQRRLICDLTAPTDEDSPSSTPPW